MASRRGQAKKENNELDESAGCAAGAEARAEGNAAVTEREVEDI